MGVQGTHDDAHGCRHLKEQAWTGDHKAHALRPIRMPLSMGVKNNQRENCETVVLSSKVTYSLVRERIQEVKVTTAVHALCGASQD